MNTNTSPFKKLLVIGLGDVARRILPLLGGEWVVVATQRQLHSVAGVSSLSLDLDASEAGAFGVLPDGVDALLYTAPPPNSGGVDARMRAVLAHWLVHGGAPKHVVYISTTGVYGDCGGAWVDERAALNPESGRAVRRVDAELQLRVFAAQTGATLTILRAPGIYALERLPTDRLRRGVPVLNEVEDGFSNHIHADDLAMMCAAALNKPHGVLAYNACDDVPVKVGEWFTRLAQVASLPVPPRMGRAELEHMVSPLQWSFMRESRRLLNASIKRDLGVVLRYPSVLDFLAAHQGLI
ncbi:hypothetical protein DTO96_100677 [Ephemeroptericola cinctiostellae]|uniref:NAD-dependent epimerase/dehydratase domain-containing protein n=1 Tax=Ephemeroptericola cinctiostellae TaxID=2268024 RepID=A0A345D9C2_9BURK|nr:SDR family NAD(P)-dependent oxidoreductase [Ephemeroptericola cinctiostellae]AXF84960.1 hypothetical protein DTO96_100677 [Ephemeroptericola cinctiostellae]